MMDTFKSLKDQLLKSEERQNVLHEKSQQLDKLNGQLRTQVAKLESDLTASQQRAKNAEMQAREFESLINGGKDFNNQKLNELKDYSDKERVKYSQRVEEDAATIKRLREEINGIKEENQKLVQFKEKKKLAIKHQLNDIVEKAFAQIVRE